MKNIENLFDKIEKFLQEMDKENPVVSKASVGWHLEHSLLILNSSLQGLTTTSPADYNPKTSFKKFVFLTFGFIPRGKIRAPKPFVPLEKPTEENIRKLLDTAKERLKKIPSLPNTSFINHPFLGNLDKKNTLRFLWLHTNHHLKIVEDILRK